MTMHRRPVPRSRLLAAVGAIVAIVGCVLPWWTVGGADGLPLRSGNAFASYGILVFAASIATLALVLDLFLVRAFAFREPVDALTRIPGLWVAFIGLAMLARATFEMAREPRLR